MGEWQRDDSALQGENDIVYLVAMTENCNKRPAVASELLPWQAELNFEAVLLTDSVREVYNSYAEANGCFRDGGPGGDGCSNAVTTLIDRDMRVRYFGSTYECGTGNGSRCGESASIPESTATCLQGALDEMKGLIDE